MIVGHFCNLNIYRVPDHLLVAVSGWAITSSLLCNQHPLTALPIAVTVLCSDPDCPRKCLYCLELVMEHSLSSQKCCLSTSYRPSGSEKWKWKSLSHVRLFATPWTVHGILQARILEWVAFPFTKGIFPTQGLNSPLKKKEYTLC